PQDRQQNDEYRGDDEIKWLERKPNQSPMSRNHPAAMTAKPAKIRPWRRLDGDWLSGPLRSL
ncbi:MAG TPA: hypothetical protein VMF66_17200, partial [Candidatus Acidoferrum sp.]|nr:hypothetical protein [Candidatus Acidoferrum sp.]